MKAQNSLATALFVASLAGCQPAPQATLVKPETINLTDAIKQIVDALNTAHANAKTTGHYVGLDVCTATVSLTLGVTGTSANGAGGTLSVAVPPVSLGVNGSTEQTLVENRANVITLALVTPACNPGGTLGTVNPDKVVQLAKENQEVRAVGMTYMLTAPPPRQ
ncbi:MAG: hypothetical protein M0Z36_14875 [Thermaerobacter sp.]|jgi:hypothetical protein|nr:hypothetical protein [Thermaerobacter sp.]